MAPALNEPLSPTTTEKLTKSSVSVVGTTVPVTRSTRRQSALGVSPTLKAASTPTEVGTNNNNNNNSNNNNNNRDQKARRSNTPESPTTTTILTRRKTRSNNKKQSTTTATTTTESMVLNAALNSSNNNNAQTSSLKENNQTEALDRDPTTSSTTTTTTTDNTTQEILANLTINFEEAISAEICLRKQLLDSNLNKETSKKTNGTELKDILVIKGNNNNNNIEEASVATGKEEEEEIASQHMEDSVLETSAKSLEKILLQNINENEFTAVENVNKNVENVVNEAEINQDVEKNVEEEVDTLEARLSQLDGSLCDTANLKATTIVEEHDLQDLHAQLQLSPVKDLQIQLKDDLKELQAQLQLSPGKSSSSSTHVDLQDLQLSPAKTADMSGLNMLVDLQQQQQHPQHSHQQQQESTNIPQIVSNTGDIEEEDLEEVIRALKTFDPANAGPETLCDLNAIFGEVYQNMNYEDVNTSTQSAAAITSSISISPIKSNPLHEAQLEIDKIQQAIQRKLEFLLRRLRKLQARHMCKHTSEELAGIFEYTVRTVNNTLSSSSLLGLESNDKKPVYMSVISARPAPEVWQKERETPVPTTQVYNLMRKIETAAKEQQLCTVSSSSTANKNQLNPVRKSRKSDGTQASTPTEPTSSCVTESIVPTLDALAVEEIAQVTGMLQAEMREVQQSIDSEATESSSGCESADEMISYNNHIQQPLPMEKRAAWRYARDRAAIAARWSWLMSHIADIDIKIRQHKELLNEIVRNKGPVIDDVTDPNVPEEDRGACRTRGALSAQFRKRKLLQTPNIHTISKKAARPSTIKCGCQWPMQPCALCTGRSDPTAPRELPNTMVKNERVALLDSGFHPVLSLPEDVSSSIYSEAVARLSDWQQRAMRCQAKTIAKGVWKAEREATGGGSNSKKYDGNTVKRRYIKKKDRLAAEAAAAAAAAANVSTSAVAESGSMAEKNGRPKQNCTMRKRITTTTTTATATTTAMEVDTHYQTISSEFPAQKYEAYNNPTNQTLNSHKNNNNNNNNRFHRNRKAFSSSSSSSSFSATTATQNRQNTLNNPLHIKNNQTQPFHHINGNSSSSETAHHHHNNNNNNNLHLHDNWDYETSMRSRTASPTHAQSSHYRSERKRSSYDIDNIVIPYSVAASTRVEIIPYKEIATPKWRIIGSDDECDEIAEDGEEKQRTVISAEQDTTLKCEDVKTTTTEDLKLKSEEKVDEKLPEDKDSTLKVKEEEEKPQISTAAVKVEEQDLKNVANIQTTESAEKPIETPILNENESLAKKEKEEQEQEQVATEEKQAEDNEADVKKLKTEVQEIKEPPRSFREKFDISSDDIKEDGQEEGEEETLEDITDTVMSMRHERGLIEERRKFQTYLKFPWTTRSRANRRGDSRAESSGANTPDPTSPAPTPSHLVGGDQESIPSPATTLAISAPTTPFTPVDSATPDALHEPFAAFDSRKHRNNNRKRCRTTSSKKDQERRSTSPDTREIILPYEPLKFPLSDAEFDDMQCLMPIEKPPEVKQESNNNNIRKPLGSYGRGRNGVRRQGHNSSTSLIRSLRPRLSNRPYVMDTKDMSDSMGLLDSFEQTIGESSGQQTLHLSGGNNYMAGDDNAEETEDETETRGLSGVAPKDDLYTDDDDDDEDDDLDEDEYDGFPRNPLATADDKILAQAAKVAEASKAQCNSDIVDSAYAAYVGHSDMFSDCDSSDPEPFKDDDPNDPEWNGEPEPPRRSRL